MATVEEAAAAMHELAGRIGGMDSDAKRRTLLDRSVTCRLTDLDVTFAGQLRDGGLHDIRKVDESNGQIRLAMTSDDLVALVAGELNFGRAWATGRVKVGASVFDLMKLRSLL